MVRVLAQVEVQGEKLMKSSEFTRRQFLKTTGALIVSFNLLPPLRSASAQTGVLPNGDLDPASLDS
jgi:hypothetical protein